LEGNLVGYIDRLITPGKLLTKDIFDPEGLLSTVPAVVTALLGMLTGTFVKQPDSKINGNRKTVYMLVGAVAMAVIAILWNQVFPVNKKLWTSSFVMAAGAYSLGLFALFYYIIDVRKWQKWTLFFRVIGLNSITIYLAQRIFKFDSISKFFLSGLASKLPEQWSTLLLQCGFVAVSWLFLYFLYKKKVFLKV
jgi:predicted acyltransferase